MINILNGTLSLSFSPFLGNFHFSNYQYIDQNHKLVPQNGERFRLPEPVVQLLFFAPLWVTSISLISNIELVNKSYGHQVYLSHCFSKVCLCFQAALNTEKEQVAYRGAKKLSGTTGYQVAQERLTSTGERLMTIFLTSQQKFC